MLARHPSIRVGLHYSGPLLEWIERAHPEYFERLRTLASRRQVEIVGGGFYEPILVAIPPEDRHEQIQRLAAYVEHHFKSRPRGAWLAERVWEPQMPSCLAPAGVEYTLVDDNHFLGSGFELEQLYGHYLSEDLGHTLKVLPGLKSLRYLIPFRDPHETTDFLRGAANSHGDGFAAMGDDLEKFGVWPGTYDHCYRDGWLERFFTALDQNSDWLATSTPEEALGSHAPLGRADLPAASYTEMMEWSLPTPARDRYHHLIGEFASRADLMPFLRGGIWRSFFAKYPESNLLHKKMLRVSEKVRRLADGRRHDARFHQRIAESTTELLRGQCNDAYWHGVFGGLYSPHLRTAVWQALEKAETIADGLAHSKRHYADVAQLDFDGDGREELYFTSDRYSALVTPDDGGTISMLDSRAPSVMVINSLRRRPESYHAKLLNLPANQGADVLSIHDQTRAKEDGLERWLRYDRWPRNSFRLLLFGQQKTYEDCSAVQLDEDAALAGGAYRATEVSAQGVTLISRDSADWPADKTFAFDPMPGGFSVSCGVALRRRAPGTASINIGIEVIVNFLAPSSPDRYFESDGNRFPLRWAAAVPGGQLRVVDEWQHAGVTLTAAHARRFWICPIETVSESEDGFERIYQGSQIIALWSIELAQDAEWRGQLILRFDAL